MKMSENNPDKNKKLFLNLLKSEKFSDTFKIVQKTAYLVCRNTVY